MIVVDLTIYEVVFHVFVLSAFTCFVLLRLSMMSLMCCLKLNWLWFLCLLVVAVYLVLVLFWIERRKEMFYLTTHSTHFIYGYIWRDYSDSARGNPLLPHRLPFLLYASSHIQDNAYYGLCYTSRRTAVEIAQRVDHE